MSANNVDDTTTTFYFEEIVDETISTPSSPTPTAIPITEDETAVEQRRSIDTSTCISSIRRGEERIDEDENIQNASVVPPPTCITYTNLKPCAHSVGGGATLTVVGLNAFVFGGCSRSGQPSGTLHRYNIDSEEWDCNTLCSTTEDSSPPQARFGHSAIAYKDYVFIFGGQGISDCQADDDTTASQCALVSFRDFYRLDTRTMEWKVIVASTMATAPTTKPEVIPQETQHGPSPWPEARNSHTCILFPKDDDDDDEIILFGGANEQHGPQNDVWSFSLETNDWRRIQCKGDDGIPCGREMHSACIVLDDGDGRRRRQMYIMGGRNVEGKICQDFWVLDLDDYKWTQLSQPPSPRCAHTTTFIRTRSRYGLYSFGGWDGCNHIFDDCTVYDLETKLWVQTAAPIASPTDGVPRFAHALCALGDGGSGGDDGGEDHVALLFGGVNMISDLRDLVLVCRQGNDE